MNAAAVAGFIIDRGVSGFESFDARERSVGIFETAHRAATALRQLAETPLPDGDVP
jgi:hypothetical protein